MKAFDKIKSVAHGFAKLDLLHQIIVVLLTAALVFAGVGFGRHYYMKRSAVTANQAEAPTEDLIEIRNDTASIEVVSKKIEKEYLGMQIRNVGVKPIISYQIDFQRGGNFIADLSIGQPLQPSRTTHVSVSLKKLALDERSQTYPVNFSMALFADGTGEGDKVKLESQRDQLIGLAAAMAKMTGLVNDLDSESRLSSEQFAQQVSSLRMTVPANFNRNQTRGYMNAIDSMQVRAMALNKSPQNKAGGVGNFKAAFARQKTNLQAFKQETK
jgi:hypothetical protein